jgi:hypothetical protein
MDHNDKNFFGWFIFLDFYFTFCNFFKKDGSFLTEKALIDNRKGVAPAIPQKLFILIPQLIGKFNSHLLFIAIEVDISAAFESNDRFPYFLFYLLLVLQAFFGEEELTALSKDQRDYLSPNLVDLLGVFMQDLLV